MREYPIKMRAQAILASTLALLLVSCQTGAIPIANGLVHESDEPFKNTLVFFDGKSQISVELVSDGGFTKALVSVYNLSGSALPIGPGNFLCFQSQDGQEWTSQTSLSEDQKKTMGQTGDAERTILQGKRDRLLQENLLPSDQLRAQDKELLDAIEKSRSRDAVAGTFPEETLLESQVVAPKSGIRGSLYFLSSLMPYVKISFVGYQSQPVDFIWRRQ